MADFTRPATWDDLRAVAALLNAAGVRYALIGGYAIAAHGYNRFSEDLDLIVEPSAENTGKWIAALSNLPDGACRELIGQDALFEQEGEYAIRINDESRRWLRSSLVVERALLAVIFGVGWSRDTARSGTAFGVIERQLRGAMLARDRPSLLHPSRTPGVP